MSSNSFSLILTKNQLVGENYKDWKRNLMVVLTAEKLKFVLTEPCPSMPNEESTPQQKEAYMKWQSSNEMARCYILGSISNVLQQKYETISTAAEIMKSLHQMFGYKGHELSYIETCLVVDSTNTWIVDSGATNHVCNSLQGFQVTRQLNEGEHTLRVGTGVVISAKAVGNVYLYFENKHLVLYDCYYVPDIYRNLISIALLFKQGYSVKFLIYQLIYP